MDFKDKYFQILFWEWFDNLEITERKKFQYYPSNMADLYFYNKYYKKLLEMNDIQLNNFGAELDREENKLPS